MLEQTHRIVSLLPSSTEIVAALGCVGQLVGRSHECDFPAGVESLPVCTEPKFDPHGTSAEIDQRVKAILQESLSVYRVDADLIQSLAPTVIVTQSQCEVCAVSFDEVQRMTCDFLDTDAQLVSLEPNGLDDVFADIQRVADALATPERGTALVSQMRERMDAVASQAAALPNKPTVALIEWIDPPMAAGNWMPSLVQMAGGVNLFGEAGQHSPWLDWGAFITSDPDVIIALPCGYDMPTTCAEMPLLAARNGWHNLRAVREGRVFVTDGNQYFNRPGPRLVESLEILAEILHPQAFDFGHRGRGWQPFN